MRLYFKNITIFGLLLNLSLFVAAQQPLLKQSNSSGIYQKGEKVEVVLEMPNLEVDSIQVKIDVNYSKNAEWKTIANPGEKLVLLSETFEEPGARVITVMAEGGETSTGFVVMPNKLRPSTKRPSDFKKYWKNEKQKLRALEWEIKSTKVEDTAPGYVCSDVELNCTGPKPARGYFAKPENAGEGTLPIVLNVHAAGVKGSWCLSKIETAVRYAEKGALSFDLNAHGMLNGQPQEYYDKLEEGELIAIGRLEPKTARRIILEECIYACSVRSISCVTSPNGMEKTLLLLAKVRGEDRRLLLQASTIGLLLQLQLFLQCAISGEL